MKRPTNWLQSIAVALAVWFVMTGGLLAYFAPKLVTWALSAAFGANLSVESAYIGWPGKLNLTQVVLNQDDNRSGASVQRFSVQCMGIDWQTKTIQLGIELEQPSIRMSRLAEGGAVVPYLGSEEGSPGAFWVQSMRTDVSKEWKLSIRRLTIVDGTLDNLDFHMTPPFRSMVHHIYTVISPVQRPYAEQPISFSTSAELVGYKGHSAPVRCSGWVAPEAKDVEVSCHLGALPVTAFQPYFVTFGKFTIREYDSTVQVTTDWIARAGEWDRRFRIVLAQVQQGDVSFRGRTVVDFKQLTKGLEPVFEGEISVGSTVRDEEGRIHGLFTPSNEVAQRLVNFFLEHNRPSLPIRFFGLPLRIYLKTATESEMRDINDSSHETQDSLEMLLFTSPDSKAPEGGAPGGAEYYGPFIQTTEPEVLLKDSGLAPNGSELQVPQAGAARAPTLAR